MGWLQNISLSNNNSSNNTTTVATSPTASPSSSSSSVSAATDSNFSKHRKLRYLKGGGLVLSFGGGGRTRITRQRKFPFVTGNDDDVTTTQQNKNSSTSCASVSVKPSANSAEPLQLSRSLSGSSPVVAAAAPVVVPPKLSSSVPRPLPLPLPLNSCDGDLRFASPRDKEKDRDGVSSRERHNGDGLSCSNSPVASVFIGRERRKMMDSLDVRSARKVHPDFVADNYVINAPTKSAPASPAVSPQRLATTADLLPHYQMIAKNQVWSAPEMATFDIPGLPPPAFFDFTTLSTDNSPLHSPPSRSPRTNPRSPTGPASPLQAKLSITETLTPMRENNANLEYHPLPLPPGASRPSISSSVAQVTVKTEVMPLKSRWQKGKLIGRGTFGVVYVASNRETGALCAMKEVDISPDDPTSAESIKQLEQEIKVLSQLKHPNIVQYYGSEIVEDHFYIYLEYVHPGSINKYVREHCGAITESVVRSFSRHILSGLAYLHSMKTVHRDIKGANLLVDASGVVKLADFGMSKHLTGQAAELSLKGSPYWMAPELMQAVMQKDTNSDLALAVDIWSLGCTIIEMFTGKPPWSDYEGAAAMFKVLKDIPPIPETLSPEGKDFLCCCFRRNPADRPSASKLLEHRWLKNSNHLDFPPSTPSINGIKSADLTHIPNASEVKLDQMPILPCSQSANGKVTSDSKTAKQYHHEASNLTMTVGVCYSPRSILEVPPISSPSSQNINHDRSSSSIPNLNKTGIKTNRILR